jgi:MarR family transcriptional regulator, negative regulator of the multidrug operon emrRAB
MDRLANLIGAFGIAVHDAQYEAISASHELGASDAVALAAIAASPGCSVDYLRTVLGITHSGAVRVSDRLAQVDLIARAAGSDGRTVGLSATAKGTRVADDITAARRAVVVKLVRSVPVAHRALMTDMFEQFLTVLAGGLSDDEAEHLCRLCDESACPQRRCPVTLASLPT